MSMVPREFQVTRRHPHSTSVEVTGGRKTDPLWKSDISGEDFARALSSAIQQSGVFTSVLQKGATDYRLEVALVKVARPMS